MANIFLKEQRCECGKLLLKGIFLQASLEIKCKKCGKISQIGSLKEFSSDENYLLVVNEKGIITNADEAACKFLEYSHDELVGKHFVEIDTYLPKEIGNKLMPPNSILGLDDYFQIDTYNLTKSGKKLAVNVLLKLYKPTEDERYVLASVTIKDKQTQIKNLNKFEEHACDFYFELDKNGLGKFISPEVEEIFGISPALGLGKSYFDFMPEENRAHAKAIFSYFVQQEKPYRSLGSISIDFNGKQTYSELFFTPNFNSEGKFVGYRVLGWLKKS